MPSICKGPSIIPGAAIWSKLTLDLLATITLEIAIFRAYSPFSALLPFLNASSKSLSFISLEET
jgi:hypothetical protein